MHVSARKKVDTDTGTGGLVPCATVYFGLYALIGNSANVSVRRSQKRTQTAVGAIERKHVIDSRRRPSSNRNKRRAIPVRPEGANYRSTEYQYIGASYEIFSEGWNDDGLYPAVPDLITYLGDSCNSTPYPLPVGTDEAATVQTNYMPSIGSICDATNPWSKCDTITLPTTCDVVNATQLQELLRQIVLSESDDCWTTNETSQNPWGDPYESGLSGGMKCKGAPEGPQLCDFEPLGQDQFATGLEVTIDGDTCWACSMNAAICPKFFDVHSCKARWVLADPSEYLDENQRLNQTFSFTYTVTVNPSSRVIPHIQVFVVVFFIYMVGYVL